MKVKAMKDMRNQRRIAKALSEVNFENYPQVAAAAKKLKGVDPREILDWISEKLLTEWHWSEVINYGGVWNIEKIFGVKFDIATLINAFFCDDEHWRFDGPASQWIDEFNGFTCREITVDDVIEKLDLGFLIDSDYMGPGICGFCKFIERNGGDFRLFIKRLASEVDRLSHEDVDDIIYCLDDYLEDGDFDMKKLYSKVELDHVTEDEIEDYLEFFSKHAPELFSEISSF